MKQKSFYILVCVLVLLVTLVTVRKFYNPTSDYMNNTSYKTGDVDGNGSVSVNDYILIRKHILKSPTLTGNPLERADVNKDKSVNASDYIIIRKIILGTYVDPNSKQKATSTPVPVTPAPTPVPKYEVKYYGASYVETGLSSVTLSGSVGVPVTSSNKINLATNTTYVVSFDYKTSGGTNQFDVDLYPDTLPQTMPTATTTSQHYDSLGSS